MLQQLLDLGRDVELAAGRALFGDVRIHHPADVNPKVASGEHSQRVLVNGVRAAVQHSRRRGSCRGGSALARESSPVATTPNSNSM